MKRFLSILIGMILLSPMWVQAMELPNLYSKKVIIYDVEEKETLYEVGANDVSNIASLTKIMTTITAIENIENLDEMVTIDQSVLKEIPYDASIAGLKLDDELTLRDLLYASILPSGADATTALAHNIAGTTKDFVEMMNEMAKKIGLKNTHFANVTGYDIPNHYSTPNEVLKILLYSLENPLFKEIYETKSYTLSNGLEVKSTLSYYNKLMNADLSSIRGSKTGYTDDAGMCMSALFESGDKELILITLGAPYSYSTPYNLKDTLTIIDYLDSNYRNTILFKEGDVLKTIPVENSWEKEYSIIMPYDIKKYLEIDYDRDLVKCEYEGLESLSFMNSKGSKIGELKCYYDEKLFLSEDIVVEKTLHFSLFRFILSHKFATIFCLVVLYILKKRRDNRRKRRRRKKIVRKRIS